ncbi:MAG: insulinase family protein [Planctomycetes bacterium]|nr:insulinase family protein [Planctomycetota bacterium]
MRTPASLLAAFLFLSGALLAQKVQVESFVLDNGMEFLLVPRDTQPHSISAGWLAKVGSANERPGITGISHFFEHMMFKGTNTIGTKDAAQDAELRAAQEETWNRILGLVWSDQYRRWRLGEIADPWDKESASGELRDLRRLLAEQMAAQRAVIEKDEFDRIYTAAGGTMLNAFTSEDMTFFFIGVPSNKFELWAWMESDRLLDSVFREFYSERDVVHEERRLRTESTPTGVFDEQFDAMFWMASPYSWPVVGWPADLNSYTLEDARRYFATYYCPNNLVGVVVGDFAPEQVKPVIARYFGRLQRGAPPPALVTLEMQQRAEQRLIAEVEAEPQVEVRYHTVPHGHADGYVFEVIASLLNGRTGRLHRGMVEGKEIASRARAGQDGRRCAGGFAFRATTKGDADPEEIEAAWYAEVERLQNEPVGERELEKVKNNSIADDYRQLRQNFFLMLQLARNEALGGWEQVNERGPRIRAVTAEEVRRVAQKYLRQENRSVAIYRRKAGAAPEDARLASLSEEQRAMAKQMLARFAKAPRAELEDARDRLAAGVEEAPEPVRPVLEYVLERLKEQLAAGGAKNEGGGS